MRRAFSLVLAGFFSLSAACGAKWVNRSRSPAVLADDTLDAREREGLEAGLAKWTRADPSIRPRLEYVPRARLLAEADQLLRGDAVYVVKLGSPDDPSCPTAGVRRLRGDPTDAVTNTAGYWGRTWSYRDQSVTCLYTPAAEYEAEGRPDADFVSRVAAHEFGHALGLGHREDVPSVMHPHTERQTGFVTPTDVADVEAALRQEEP